MEPEAEMTKTNKEVIEEVATTPQNPAEQVQEAAPLPSHDLPGQKEVLAEVIPHTEEGNKEDTGHTHSILNEELTIIEDKQESKGLISPTVKDIKSAIEAKEEELAQVRKSARIPTRRGQDKDKSTPEKVNPLGLTGTPTEEAMKNVGIEPYCDLIRGGTDGSRLSFMGMPCPNLFTGEMAIQTKPEYVVVQDMQKSVKTLIELIQIWERKHES